MSKGMDNFQAFEAEPTSQAEIKQILDQYDRARILEVYFSRLDGRLPERIPAEISALYTIRLEDIKEFLLGQRPADPLLEQFINSRF